MSKTNGKRISVKLISLIMAQVFFVTSLGYACQNYNILRAPIGQLQGRLEGAYRYMNKLTLEEKADIIADLADGVKGIGRNMWRSDFIKYESSIDVFYEIFISYQKEDIRKALTVLVEYYKMNTARALSAILEYKTRIIDAALLQYEIPSEAKSLINKIIKDELEGLFNGSTQELPIDLGGYGGPINIVFRDQEGAYGLSNKDPLALAYFQYAHSVLIDELYKRVVSMKDAKKIMNNGQGVIFTAVAVPTFLEMEKFLSGERREYGFQLLGIGGKQVLIISKGSSHAETDDIGGAFTVYGFSHNDPVVPLVSEMHTHPRASTPSRQDTKNALKKYKRNTFPVFVARIDKSTNKYLLFKYEPENINRWILYEGREEVKRILEWSGMVREITGRLGGRVKGGQYRTAI